MVEQARLEELGSGQGPVTEGWFVVNAADGPWVRNDAFGARCGFESSERVLADRPDVAPVRFEEAGFNVAVLEPGKPSGMYHSESVQEDFLVLSGECVLVIEEEERTLRAWDFVHCPAGTRHILIGAGDGPCVVFMVGARGAGQVDLLSALRLRARAWRRRRDRDECATGGVRAVPEVAARTAGRVGRAALGLGRERDHAADPVLLLHQLEAAVHLVEREPVRDQRRDVDLAVEPAVDELRHPVAALDAAE